MSPPTLTPEVLWAQRSSADDPAKNIIYLTITAADVLPKDLQLKLDSKTVTFTGYSSSKDVNYHVELKLHGEIDPDESKTHHTSRGVELVLRKKDAQAEFWPRLLEGGKKVHFLKTDFDKWVDEDEQDEVADEDPYAAMGGMGGMGGGMGDMGGMGGGDGGFGGIDFSKLGGAEGMAGMPGLEGLGAMGGMGGEEGSDDDDDEVPGLEEAEEKDAPAAAAGESKSKIEEVA